jgi:hypothetical protein
LFLLAGLLLVVAIWPRATWLATAGWQFKNPEGAELRPGVYVARSVSAVVGALMLVGAGIWLLATEDRRECEKAMSDLAYFARGVDFDQSDIGELADDLGSRWDLDAAAASRDLELVDSGPGEVEVVDQDGDVLGTLDDEGAHPTCE